MHFEIDKGTFAIKKEGLPLIALIQDPDTSLIRQQIELLFHPPAITDTFHFI